jgi:hypothetical protein
MGFKKNGIHTFSGQILCQKENMGFKKKTKKRISLFFGPKKIWVPKQIEFPQKRIS